MTWREDLPIRIDNPHHLPDWQLPARRLDLGAGYKPSLALLPGGELVMVSLLQTGSGQDGTFTEVMPVRRSADGGQTWSEPLVAAGVVGREHWLTCTSRGTLLATSHLLIQDRANEDGNCHSYVHRSTDGGCTWTAQKVQLAGDERCGQPPDKGTHTSRNVVELPDGTLLLGVSITDSKVAYLWRSTDDGVTWDRSMGVGISPYRGQRYDNYDGFFAEDFTYLTADGSRLLHWLRCGPPSPMFPMEDGRPVPAGNDNIDRSLLCHSDDGGRTWSGLRDFGDYGMHYARPLRLGDGRLLLTYTQRGVRYPLGLRGTISRDDGATWELGRDQLVIEARTSWGLASGGGFGNTVQLADGDLLTAYSYAVAAGEYRIELAHWGLP